MAPTAESVDEARPGHVCNESLFRALEGVPDARRRDELRDEIFVRNQGLALSVAFRYRRRGADIEDLSQVACLGLVKAINGYRVDRGTPFHAYAVPTIAGEVKRYFRDRVWAVRPPRHVQEVRRAAQQAEERLGREHGRTPDRHEVAYALGITLRELDEVELAGNGFSTLSLDAPAWSDAESTLGDRLATGAEEFERVDFLESVRLAVRTLSDRDRRIISMRFEHGMSQVAIGRELNLSQMQVSRLLARIIRTLRAALELQDAAA